MISNKKDLIKYLQEDAKALRRKTLKKRLFGDEIWKFQIALRKTEFYKRKNIGKIKRLFEKPMLIFWHLQYKKWSIKLGFSIPLFVFDEGLSIAHYGTIVVSPTAHIGKNCRIHEGVNIGATNGSAKAPQLGDNIFIATGAKIIGDITIANDVCIGANAVVVKDITEPSTTYAGVPAKKISDNNSHSNLSSLLDFSS